MPAVIYFIIFSYLPFYGIQIAFKDFKIFNGIWGSPWVGFENYRSVFSSGNFINVVKNTLLISAYHLFWGFPIPIIFALMLNEVKFVMYKRTIQTISYFPHFLSWVVFGGLIFRFFGSTGVVNDTLRNFDLPPIGFLSNPALFRSTLVGTAVLKSYGWSSIIYIAALSGINQDLYEAAKVDGAGKLRQLWHISLPGLRPTIVFLLIMNIGHILSAGFDQVYMLYNPAVYGVADIIDTYVYRIGLQQAQYEIATAVGLFKGVVSLILILSGNYIARKYEGRSLW
jgi:putative aldouronate transport system permease protein